MSIYLAQIGAGALNMTNYNGAVTMGQTNWNTNAAGFNSSATGTLTLPSAKTEIWCHFYVDNGAVSTFTAVDNAFLRVRNNADGRDLLRALCTDGAMTLQAWNGSSWVQLGSSSITFAFEGNPFLLDIHIKLGNSDGEFEVFIGNELRLSFYGDTITNASTSFDQVIITDPSTNTGNYSFGEILVCDEYTVGAKLTQPNISADGADTAWTGAYTTVDEIGSYSDADLITVGTVGTLRSFVVNDMPALFDPAGAYYIAAVSVNLRARYSGGAPNNVSPYLRSDGINYYGGIKTLTTSFAWYGQIWETDPDTGYAWDESAYNSIQIGVRSET
jgi:hypothetical protein